MPVDQKFLDGRDLPEIFAQIFRGRLTGMLFAERMKYKRCVYFRDGAAIFATSNLSEDKIGKILFTQGKVGMDQLLEALDAAKTGKKRLGSVLVEKNYISAKDLFEAVVLQVEQIIYSLFRADWSDARYSFDPSSDFGDEVIRLSLQPAEVLIRGIRLSYDAERVQHSAGSPAGVYLYDTTTVLNVDKMNLSQAEKAFCNAIDGQTSAERLMTQTGVAPADAYSILLGLTMLGYIQPRAGAVAHPPVAAGAAAAAAEAPLELELASPEPAAQPVRKAARPAQTRTLNVSSRGAPSAAELKAEATRLRLVNYYDRLGIDRAADSQALMQAFAALRRKYADELTEELRAAALPALTMVTDAHRVLAVDVTRRIYDKLLDEGNTPAEAELKYRVRAAHLRYEEGIKSWESRLFDNAEFAFREAISYAPTRPDYLFALGLALAAQDKGAPAYDEVESVFAKAAALQSDHPRGHYYLGTVYRMRGETEKAIRAYQKALALDSRYQPARDGLEACGVTA